ncbi:MAG TPA: hypothetical protein VK203_05140 [Nostocaceae cyanobacterium]|nr:hypothetical protein [Nostocaceae cyanobacterium]
MRTPTGYGQTPPPNPSYSPSVPLHVYRELATQLQAVEAKLDVVTAHNQKLAQENQLLRHEIARVAQAMEQLQKLADSSSIPYTPPKPHPSAEVNNTPPEPPPRPSTEVRNTPPEPQPRPSTEVRNTHPEPRPTAEVKNPTKPPRQGVLRPRSKTKSQVPPKQHRREEYLETGVEVNYQTTPRSRPHEAPPSKQRREEFLVEHTVEVAYPMSEAAYIEEEEIRYYPAPEESELKELSSWWLLVMIVLIILTGFSAGYFFVRPFFQPQSR